MQKLWARSLQCLVGVCAIVMAAAASAQTPGIAAGDFNGDGHDDLAISIPHHDVGAATDAGAVLILYGDAAGLTATGNKLFHQNKNNIASNADANDKFSSTLATGDFNGDGFDDLAIGVPNEMVGTAVNAGAVHILHGTANGLKPTGSKFWTQEKNNILNKSKANDNFGTGLVAGDFNGDGFDDLAIGSPGDKVSSLAGAGGVNVLYGSANSLKATNNQYWSLNSTDVPDDPAAGDNFGYYLTAGDFNGDGFEDLAISAPGKTVNTFMNAGSVTVLYGSAAGLTAVGAQSWTQDSTDILDDAEMSDQFGSTLATGDFNDDGYFDLVCGVPEEGLGAFTSCGVVQIIYGSAAGLTAVGNQLWSQDSSTMLDAVESGDAFGNAMAAGDFNDDGFDDLAVGVPGENFVAGAVAMLLGSAAGLTDVGNKYFDQDTPNVLDDSASIEAFGYTLCAGRFDGDTKFDLAIGVPFEDIDGIDNCGAVNILYGHPTNTTGLGAPNNQFFHKNTDGIPGNCTMNDLFGGL